MREIQKLMNEFIHNKSYAVELNRINGIFQYIKKFIIAAIYRTVNIKHTEKR